ncbi:hypothetical protein [Falsiroseomonas sp. CW058]|uniref:hypothetical protein n=1 Tax=Falsiroseomonas sp. CW058 TaxID=3388664 RepID=UPI003D32061E
MKTLPIRKLSAGLSAIEADGLLILLPEGRDSAILVESGGTEAVIALLEMIGGVTKAIAPPPAAPPAIVVPSASSEAAVATAPRLRKPHGRGGIRLSDRVIGLLRQVGRASTGELGRALDMKPTNVSSVLCTAELTGAVRRTGGRIRAGSGRATSVWEWVGDSGATPPAEPVRQPRRRGKSPTTLAVLGALAGGHAMTSSEIRSATGLSRAALSNELVRLADEGRIEKTKVVDGAMGRAIALYAAAKPADAPVNGAHV